MIEESHPTRQTLVWKYRARDFVRLGLSVINPAATVNAPPPQPFKEGGMPMPSEFKQAETMFDSITSVGATSFVVTKIDVEQKQIWGRTYSTRELAEKLPAMVRTADKRKPHALASGQTVMVGENLVVRPTSADITFVQLDDVAAEQLERWGSFGTSRPRLSTLSRLAV